jgi:hypothetical protein
MSDDEETEQPKIDAITLTFGDCMENHAGMQKVGKMAAQGFSYEDLKKFNKFFKELGATTLFYNLNRLLSKEHQEQVDDTAYFLVIRKGVNYLSDDLSNCIYKEQSNLTHDKKYFDTRRSKVLNKIARWNLCFDDTGQEADLENKKGTIVAYKNVPFTSLLSDHINELVGSSSNKLKLEGNYYYDIKKTGIGYHGDGERRKVIGTRFGKNNPIAFKWFHDCKEVSRRFSVVLNDSDIYFMSEKAVGTDWKKRSLITLRHAAGNKYI